VAIKKKSVSKDNNWVDSLVLIGSILYMQSVLTVAHHTAMWRHDGTSHIVESPAVPLIVIGLLFSVYSVNKAKGKFSVLLVISLTIFVTSSLFWLSGLRTNFYF
jgi:hypothetical protein